jgi:hypothetical protein
LNNKLKKATAIVLASSFVLSLITIVYANHPLGFLPLILENMPITGKLSGGTMNAEEGQYPTVQADTLLKNKQSGIIDRISILNGTEASPNNSRMIMSNKNKKIISNPKTKNTYKLMDNNQAHQGAQDLKSAEAMDSEKPVSIINGKEQEYHARRAEKLQLLSEAYPNEYEIIKSKIENANLLVNVLEFIDYYVIDDINLLIDDFNSEGYKELEKHAITERNKDNRVLK